MGGTVLINSSTGKPEWVDSAHVKEAVERGSHYSKTGRVNVTSDYTGSNYNTTVAGSATQRGITPESQGEEIKRDYTAAENAKYDNGYDKFLAATEGFASSLTFGASDILTDDYASRKRAEVNSGWRTFGEVVGIVAPAIATGGASIEAKAGVEGLKTAEKSLLSKAVGGVLKNTPAGLASRAGIKAGEKVGARLVEGSVKQRIAAAAVESAVEGAMWNTGQTLSDAIIEDKELSAEALLGSAAEGAGFGGAVGGGFAAAGAAIKAFKGRKPVAHALFDLESEVSTAFRQKMVGSAAEAVDYAAQFQQKLDALDILARRGPKGNEAFKQWDAANEAFSGYKKANAGYRKMLGLKAGHTAEEAEKALKDLMKRGSKNDIIAFAKKLDDLHSATAAVDDLLGGGNKFLDDGLRKPEDLVGGYELPPRVADDKNVPPWNRKTISSPEEQKVWEMGPATSKKTEQGIGGEARAPKSRDPEAGIKTGVYSEADHAAIMREKFGPKEPEVRFADFPADAIPGHTEGRIAGMSAEELAAPLSVRDSQIIETVLKQLDDPDSVLSEGFAIGFDRVGAKQEGKTLNDYAAAISAASHKDQEKVLKALAKTEPDLAAKLNAIVDNNFQTKVGNAKGKFPDPVPNYQGGRAGGMNRNVSTPGMGQYGDMPPLPFIADYQNRANAISNEIMDNAARRAAEPMSGFSARKYSDEVADLAGSLKDEYGAKFNAMDTLYVADALGMDVNKVPVLGPVADSFLKLWVFYRMGGMIGKSKVVKSAGKSRLVKDILEHVIARKAGGFGGKQGGVIGAVAGYQAGRAGARAALDGVGNIGAHTESLTGRIRGAVDKVLTPGVKKLIKKTSVPAYFKLSSATYSVPLDTDPKDDYGRIAAQLERSANDQGSLEAYLNTKYEDARILDAGLADAIITAQKAQYQYLYGILPKPPISWPQGMKWAPPASEMIEFKNAAAILANPRMVLDRLEDGTLTKSELDHTAKLWPAIHNKIVEATMDKIQDFEKLSVPQKKMVSLITGQTLVPSVDPWLISYTQEQYAKAKNEEESHNATMAGANSVKAGTATPGQQYGLGPKGN